MLPYLGFYCAKRAKNGQFTKNPQGSLFHFYKMSTRKLFIFRIDPTCNIYTLTKLLEEKVVISEAQTQNNSTMDSIKEKIIEKTARKTG